MTARARRTGRSRSTKLWRTGLVVGIIVLLVGFRLVEQIGPERHPDDRFTVVRVIDGDTVELLGGDRLRLLGVDTPERDEPLFDEARQFLVELALGRSLELEFAGSRRDRYGRLLAFAYVDDSVLVNKVIIENGLGYLYLFRDSPTDHPAFAAMMQAQRAALDRSLGVMAPVAEPEPYYVASQSSFRFHRPGCRSAETYTPDRWRRFGSREEALREGLSPCRNCRP
jgi:endonuclease YncB( thermonuclease family)